MIFKYAIRNVMRNRRRSIGAMFAIFTGVVIVLFTQGLMDGMLIDLTDNYIKFQTGNFRFTTPDYGKRERFLPVDQLISDTPLLIDRLQSIPGIILVEKRVRFGLLMGQGENTVPAMGIGLDFKNTSLDIKAKITQGGIPVNGMVIGSGLAARIGCKTGDEILIATNTAEGGLNGIKVGVSGIFKYGITMFDNEVFFLDLASASRLLKLGEDFPEILVYARNPKAAERMESEIRTLNKEGLLIKNFSEQVGGYWSVILASMKILYIFEFIILVLASFVIFNTMMQTIFERLEEIGTLKALGMTDNAILWNFTVEGAVMGLLGGGIGGVAGHLMNIFLSKHALSFEKAMESVEMPMSYSFRNEPNVPFTVIAVIAAAVISGVAASIPALYAKKLSSAEALKKV